tara:strand:+ start:2323 stop:2478 length:156 start_codon:yes stop_codon:yes gene_type:complete
MKFRFPNRKLYVYALRLQRWPVTWCDEKVEAKRKKEELRKKKIESLYPNKK